MHSNRVVRNLDTGQNRFKLCHQAFRAVRKLLNDNSYHQRMRGDAPRPPSDTEQPLLSVNPQLMDAARAEAAEQPTPDELSMAAPREFLGVLRADELAGTDAEQAQPIS